MVAYADRPKLVDGTPDVLRLAARVPVKGPEYRALEEIVADADRKVVVLGPAGILEITG